MIFSASFNLVRIVVGAAGLAFVSSNAPPSVSMIQHLFLPAARRRNSPGEIIHCLKTTDINVMSMDEFLDNILMTMPAI